MKLIIITIILTISAAAASALDLFGEGTHWDAQIETISPFDCVKHVRFSWGQPPTFDSTKTALLAFNALGARGSTLCGYSANQYFLDNRSFPKVDFSTQWETSAGEIRSAAIPVARFLPEGPRNQTIVFRYFDDHVELWTTSPPSPHKGASPIPGYPLLDQILYSTNPAFDEAIWEILILDERTGANWQGIRDLRWSWESGDLASFNKQGARMPSIWRGQLPPFTVYGPSPKTALHLSWKDSTGADRAIDENISGLINGTPLVGNRLVVFIRDADAEIFLQPMGDRLSLRKHPAQTDASGTPQLLYQTARSVGTAQ